MAQWSEDTGHQAMKESDPETEFIQQGTEVKRATWRENSEV